MTYKDEMQEEVKARIREENHILVLSTPKDSITLDKVTVLDGMTAEVIAMDVPVKTAQEFIDIWNGMLGRGEKVSDIRKIDIGRFLGIKTRKAHRA